MQKRGPAKARLLPSLCRSAFLLAYGEINSLYHVAGFIPNLDVPRSLCIGRDRLAAPGPPWRSADDQRHVAHLIAAVKPDVMQRLATGIGYAHPQNDRTD